MGRIPEYQRQQASLANPSNVDRADDIGNIIASGADAAQDFFQRQRQAQEANFLSSRAIDLETRASQRMIDWQKNNASNPLGQEKSLQEAIQKDIEEIGGAAPSDQARSSLQRMGDDLKRRLSVQGNQWANQQLVKNIGDDIDRSSQTLQLEAFRTADPNKLEDIFKQHDMLLVSASTAMSKEAVDSINQVGKREITANLVQGMIEKDRLGDAQRLLDSKKYDEVLGADNTRRAYEMIDRKREMFQNRQEKLLSLKGKQPWKYLTEIGETKGLPPVQLEGDPKSIINSFTKRESFIAEKSKKHAMEIPFLSDGEVDYLADSFMARSPTDAAALMNNLDDKISPQQKALIGRQLFAKEPGLSAAMMIAGDDKNSAAGIVKGMTLLRRGPEGTGKPVDAPADSAVEEAFEAYVGTAIEDPGARLAIKQAATALMTNNVFSRGKSPKDFVDNDLKEALKSVMGPVADINGVKTASFRGKQGQFLNEDQFEDLVDELRDNQVEKILGDVPRTASGDPINLKKANGRIKLKAVGEGQYWIFTEEGLALDKNKRPFNLDLKAIEAGKPPGKTWRDYANAARSPKINPDPKAVVVSDELVAGGKK